MAKPIKNMIAARLNVFVKNLEVLHKLIFLKLKLIAFPTTNKKVGKTRSVSVKPCQGACLKGA